MTPLLHRLHRPRALVYGAAALVILLTTVVVPATGAFEMPRLNPFGAESFEGEVLAVEVSGREQISIGTIRSELIAVRLAGGEEIVIERQFVEGDTIGIAAEPGDRVLVTANESPGGTTYFLADRSRAHSRCGGWAWRLRPLWRWWDGPAASGRCSGWRRASS